MSKRTVTDKRAALYFPDLEGHIKVLVLGAGIFVNG
jgi:hypothetical protein